MGKIKQSDIRCKENTCIINHDIKEFLVRICDLAKGKDIFLEINELSITRAEGGSAKRLTFWLNYANRNGNKFSIGSDAHYRAEVGRFPNVLKFFINKIQWLKYKNNRHLKCLF